MRPPVRSWVLACLAAGLVGTAAPVAPAHAEPDFGGYSAEAMATPLKLEIYEPTIPIPATPQAEMELAYTKAEAASGPSGTGVASWLWPGDPVGQGFKTFMEAFGLAELGKDGYPIQVNSRTPGEPGSESDERFPGSLMRTSADEKGVRSTVGWSTDGDVSAEQQGDAPEQPEAPVDPADALGAAITGSSRTAPAEEPPSRSLPPQLAALVDVDGMVSTSRIETLGDTVRAIATSKLHQVSILGGVITADSITVTSTTTADGQKPTASGVSKVVGLELAGTPIIVGREGVQLADQGSQIPGLSDNPGKALEQLGVSLVLPHPEQSVRGDSGTAAFQGLQIVIDTRPLRANLDDIPFDQVIDPIPDGEGTSELKSLLGAATQLAPKFVITAGNSSTETSTVPKMAFDLPTVDPGALTGAAAPPASGTGSAAAAPGAGAPPLGGEAGAAAAAGGDAGALAAEPMSAGLPPLASIPGALMVGGIILASGVGWWLQRIGGLVLGGAGTCSHGLETGVPDLRRA